MDAQTTAGRVVTALQAEGLLAPGSEERSRAVVAQTLGSRGPAAGQGMSKLVEVVAYLGGALVLAAGVLFLATTWDDLSGTGQVVALAVVALVLGIAGFTAADRDQPEHHVRRRLGGTLLTGSAVAAGFAVGLVVDLSTDLGSSWPSVAGSLVAAVVAAIAYRWCSTAVGLVGILGGTLGAVLGLADQVGNDEALYVGVASFVVAVGWLALAEIGVFEQPTVARVLGSVVALFGAQVAAFSDTAVVGYLLCVVVVGAGVWLYLTRLDWPYLAGAVLAVTLVVPEAVSDWTDGSLGVVGGVLVAGVTLLAASLAGYRLRTEAAD